MGQKLLVHLGEIGAEIPFGDLFGKRPQLGKPHPGYIGNAGQKLGRKDLIVWLCHGQDLISDIIDHGWPPK